MTHSNAGKAGAAVRLAHFPNGVRLLRIDNPPVNALGSAARAAMLDRLATISTDDEARAVILAGRGDAFCAGDDLKEALSGDRGRAVAEFTEIFMRIEALAVPVIAAIAGACTGGGLELALCCDIRLAGQSANLAASGVNVGLVASATRLARLIGVARAKSALMSGERIGAAEAFALGLVAAVHPDPELEEGALKLAARLASRAPLSLGALKRILSPDASSPLAMEQALALELAASHDHREAVAAFVERRTPQFRGR